MVEADGPRDAKHRQTNNRDRMPEPPRSGGGGRRDRTDDLKLAKLALSQLSYAPCGLPSRSERQSARLRPEGFDVAAFTHLRSRRLVGLARFELATSRLSSARSNQLSYKPLGPEVRKQKSEVRNIKLS